MNLKFKLLSALCALSTMLATVAVNVTCNYHYYQEELNPQLASLKKYREE